MNQNKKKILVVLGHPNPNSLCAKFAQVYTEAAVKEGHSVEILRLIDQKFDYNLRFGYGAESVQTMEPEIRESQNKISKADHLVFVFPSWWASMPSVLKGWIDRVFIPGFSFQYQKHSPFPKQLLKGKTAHILVTMDAPTWYYKLVNWSPGIRIMKKGTLEFCGVGPVKVSYFDQVRKRKEPEIANWIQRVMKLGSVAA